MGRHDLLIRAPRAILEGGEGTATVVIDSGRIVGVEPMDFADDASSEVLELDADTVLLPGLVDSHVHVCEPGNTEWEGFATATRAAAAGGITTLIDMPLDSIPTTVNVEALEAKRAAAEGQCHVDVGFWGGLIPGNLGDLEPLHEAGVLGFKCFLADSGSDDFPPVTPSQMEEALGKLQGLNAPLLVHAESAEASAALPASEGRSYADYLRSRPRGLENLAVAQTIEAARRSGAHAHVLHLSSSDAVPMIESARSDGVRITAESCPHYLVVDAEQIPDGATAFKCSPPIRERQNQDLLWDGLRRGVIDQVVSDHSPCTPAMKELVSGDFGRAWGGISSLQLALPLVWTGAQARGFALGDVVRWMAERPARLASLKRKGRIAVGFDADLSVFAPDEEFTVDPAQLHHRHPVTPYAGRQLNGVVRRTLLHGEWIDYERPIGTLLRRTVA